MQGDKQEFVEMVKRRGYGRSLISKYGYPKKFKTFQASLMLYTRPKYYPHPAHWLGSWWSKPRRKSMEDE